MSLAGLHHLRPRSTVGMEIVNEIVNGQSRVIEVPISRAHLPITPLDATDPFVFEWWCSQPAHDNRTIEEFAADGGYPMFPPNRPVPPIGGTGEKPPPPPRPPSAVDILKR